MRSILRTTLITLTLLSGGNASYGGEAVNGASYDVLLKLFADWRAFEQPPLRDGAPDYTAPTFAARYSQLASYRARLDALKAESWPVAQQVDLQLLRAEMNGFDFYVRVLKPWQRDPAFYQLIWTAQSDTPAHEGPTNHAAIDLWTFQFPLNAAAAAKLTQDLRVMPPLLAQAKTNLTGNAHDLWMAGIGTIKQQDVDLAALEQRAANASPQLSQAIKDARAASTDFIAWLERAAPTKTGPSGVGKENYGWSQRNVYLVPLSWDEEVAILQRELARAHASLKFEEQRNRGLPPMTPIASPEEFQRRANAAVTKYIAFLKAKHILPMRDYMEPALRAQTGQFTPLESRNFFAIATHYEPLTLYTHFYHWWDLAQMREMPHESVLRRAPLLYNIWVSRAEGMATAMEEMMLHAGLFDDEPRAREIIWIMLAQRAARGLASLRAQANEFSLAQAKDFQVAWTPRGWMRPDLDLLGFEQQLYLRQPGYGTSYITGKYLIEQLMMTRAKQLGESFTTEKFFAEFNAAGLIPVSLIDRQLTSATSH